MLKDSTEQVQSRLELHSKNYLFLSTAVLTNLRAAISIGPLVEWSA